MISSINGDTASHIVFVIFAPIASPTSINNSAINIFPAGVSISLQEISFAPLFIFGKELLLEFASFKISSEEELIFCIAESTSTFKI